MKLFLSVIVSFIAICSTAQQPVDVWDDLQSGNWEECTQHIEAFYAQKGLYADVDLGWDKKEVNLLYNTYSSDKYTVPVIEVADFVRKEDVWTHWDFWSLSLTKSTWAPKSFFKNKKEALMLARYNTFILLSHEFGHHLSDRYGVEAENLNCKEYGADKISFGFEQWLAKESKFKDLQTRYRGLLKQINHHVKDENRFEYKAYSVLEDNCGCIDVKYPKSPDLMVQYASAFFVRREALYQNQGQFSFEQYINNQHLKSSLAWIDKYPQYKISCDSSHQIERRLALDKTTSFDKGVKLMYAWGEGFNQNIELEGFGFNDSGQFYQVQANINKLVSPGDLWDFRFYSADGYLEDIWYTKPPIMDSVSMANIHSVYIGDVHANVALLIDFIKNENQHNFYLLTPSSDKLSLDWYWLGTNKPTGLSITDLKLVDNVYLLKLSGSENFKTGPMKDYKQKIQIDQIQIPKSTLSIDKEAISYKSTASFQYVFATNFYLLGYNSNDNKIYTLAGNGIKGRRCDNNMIEVPRTVAIRIIANHIYLAHPIYKGERGYYLIRRLGISKP